MKIKVINKSYDEAMAIKPPHHKKPLKPSIFFRTLMKVLAIPNVLKTHLKHERVDMERLGKKEPALYLMNHSCFIDLEIIPTILFPRPFNIVATRDTFIGKNLLIRLIGCIPTSKFVADTTLVRDIMHAIKKQKSSVVMFPEAGYSLDGRTTVLPDSLGKLAKLLGVPVISVMTEGAFARDPLYNNLQIRKVDVKVTEKYLLSPEEIKAMTPEEINERIRGEFAFDNFRWQRENKVKIDEPFRADHLNRVLYKCPHCMTEGKTEGKGIELVCHACGKRYELAEDGFMRALEGETEYPHVPDWYAWERECVKQEILDGTYRLDVAVDVYAMIDTSCIHSVGEGRLVHTREGFHLTGCDGQLDYIQKPLSSYSLYADYYWYKMGDMICVGDKDVLYYCFPKDCGDVVAKTRLASEELYKIVRAEKRTPKVVNKSE